MTNLQSIIMGVVEGLTEFLPVSSTGHLIITQHILQIADSDFIKSFEVSIQLGAILAVFILYFKKLFQKDMIQKLIIGFIPTGFAGLFLYKYVKQLLDSEMTVGIMLLLGGIVILFVERWYSKKTHTSPSHMSTEITLTQAFYLGCYQTLALIPGTSRSGSMIVGGLLMKLPRKVITEFTFLLAVPTMFVATVYTIHKDMSIITNVTNLSNLVLGFVVSFVVAMIVIKYFLAYIRKHSFAIFGVYRIIAGVCLLLYLIS